MFWTGNSGGPDKQAVKSNDAKPVQVAYVFVCYAAMVV